MGRMILWPLLLLTLPAFAQVDLSAIQKLDEKLPDYNRFQQTDQEIEFQRQNREHVPYIRKVSLKRILSSGTQYGAIRKGFYIRNIDENKNYQVQKLMYVKVFNLEDEYGFKYIQNKDGSALWRVRSEYVEPIKEEVALYEPPLKYTPAPLNIVHTEYDSKLKIAPEMSVSAGIVQGNFMKDLFNDKKAASGISNQYGLHFFTQWNLPIKAGGVFQYERASYQLTGSGQVIYSSPSLGPQFKTKEFEIFDNPIRFQMQFRVSPLAKATTKTSSGTSTFKFNSADLLSSIERPIKNSWGEFVLGLYFQAQWLSLKGQPSNVSVKATNATNNSFGLSIAQVFE